MSLRQQSRIMAAQQSGAFDAALRSIIYSDAILAACSPDIADFEAEGHRLDREADQAFARRHGVVVEHGGAL